MYYFYDRQYTRNTRDHPSIAGMISCIPSMSVGIEGIQEITPPLTEWSHVLLLWPSVYKEYKRSPQHCWDDLLYSFYERRYRRNTRDHPSIAGMISCIPSMSVGIEGIQEITPPLTKWSHVLLLWPSEYKEYKRSPQHCWDDLLYSFYDRRYRRNTRDHPNIW